MTKKGTEFTALSYCQVVEELRRPVPTLVLFHQRPDGDAVGSAFALAVLLRALGSKAYCLCADEVPEHLSFLTADKQQSVGKDSLPKGFENARVVTVDTASPQQLGALSECFLERVSLMIDHHKTGTPYADGLIVPEAAATGEIVYQLFLTAGVPLTKEASTLLYAAISSDTGCFRYSNTTENTHKVAASLVATGLDTAEINRCLFEAKSYAQMKAETAGFDRLEFFREGKVAILTFPLALRDALGVKDEHLGTLIDVARAVRGVEIAAAIRETEEKNTYRASFRANGNYNVADMAAAFGGGGHIRAAGATVIASSVEHAKEQVLAEILKGLEG